MLGDRLLSVYWLRFSLFKYNAITLEEELSKNAIIYQPYKNTMEYELKLLIDYCKIEMLTYKEFVDTKRFEAIKEILSLLRESKLSCNYFIVYSQASFPLQGEDLQIFKELLNGCGAELCFIKTNNTNKHDHFLDSIRPTVNAYRNNIINYYEFVGNVSNQFFNILNQIEPFGCQCTLCGWQGNKFLTLPTRNGWNDHQVCPLCNTHARHRNFYNVLQAKSLLKSSVTLLDVAPMEGLSEYIKDNVGTYISTDIENDRKPSLICDLQDLSFLDNSFNIILCMQVLEHIMDDRRALRELVRVLKDDGLLILSVPYNKIEGSITREYGAPDPEEFGHVRAYGHDVIKRFEEQGVSIELVNTHEGKTRAEIQKNGLGSVPDIFFFARKK